MKTLQYKSLNPSKAMNSRVGARRFTAQTLMGLPFSTNKHTDRRAPHSQLGGPSHTITCGALLKAHSSRQTSESARPALPLGTRATTRCEWCQTGRMSHVALLCVALILRPREARRGIPEDLKRLLCDEVSTADGDYGWRVGAKHTTTVTFTDR
jgi:hypothetical protein